MDREWKEKELCEMLKAAPPREFEIIRAFVLGLLN
jgi:hypothetical protein